MIFSKMAVNKMPFYKVLDSDGKTILDQNDDEDTTVDEAANRLRDTLENLTGLITVVLSDYSGKQKGAGGNKATNIRFSIKLTDGDIRGINGNSELREDTLRNAISREYEAKFEALKEKFEHEKAMAKMQAQIDEMKNGNDLDKYLPVITGLLSQQSGALAGMPEQPHITGTGDSPKERLLSAINRIIKVDSNFVENIERLADLAENNPMIYKIAIDKLKSM